MRQPVLPKLLLSGETKEKSDGCRALELSSVRARAHAYTTKHDTAIEAATMPLRQRKALAVVFCFMFGNKRAVEAAALSLLSLVQGKVSPRRQRAHKTRVSRGT